MRVKVEVDPPLEEVEGKLRRFRGSEIQRGILGNLAKVVHSRIHKEAPQKTGDLKKAIVLRQAGAMTWDITIDQGRRAYKYEHYVRLGTAPHVIRPVKKKALFWPGLPHPVKSANHPGTKANPYFDRGIDNSQGDIRQAEEEMGIKIEQELTQ